MHLNDSIGELIFASISILLFFKIQQLIKGAHYVNFYTFLWATFNSLFCGGEDCRVPTPNMMELEKGTYQHAREMLAVSLIHGGPVWWNHHHILHHKGTSNSTLLHYNELQTLCWLLDY